MNCTPIRPRRTRTDASCGPHSHVAAVVCLPQKKKKKKKKRQILIACPSPHQKIPPIFELMDGIFFFFRKSRSIISSPLLLLLPIVIICESLFGARASEKVPRNVYLPLMRRQGPTESSSPSLLKKKKTKNVRKKTLRERCNSTKQEIALAASRET